MKHIILALFCMVSFVSVSAQSKIVNFFSATVSSPIDKKIFITDVIYRDGKFYATQERIVKSCKFKQDSMNNEIDTLIDEAQLVNYKSDTLYILSTHYIPDASSLTTIKTRKGVFDFVHNADGGYTLCSLKDSSANISEDEKRSIFSLYEAIFTWNIKMLISLIKSSGVILGSENVMSATRIILKNNHVLKKDIINFEPALRWHLD